MIINIRLHNTTIHCTNIFYEDIDGKLVKIDGKNFVFRIESFHAFLFNRLRILFYDEQFLFSNCVGFLDIPLLELTKESTKLCSIHSERDRGVYQCYETIKKSVGSVSIDVKVQIIDKSNLKDEEIPNDMTFNLENQTCIDEIHKDEAIENNSKKDNLFGKVGLIKNRPIDKKIKTDAFITELSHDKLVMNTTKYEEPSSDTINNAMNDECKEPSINACEGNESIEFKNKAINGEPSSNLCTGNDSIKFKNEKDTSHPISNNGDISKKDADISNSKVSINGENWADSIRKTQHTLHYKSMIIKEVIKNVKFIERPVIPRNNHFDNMFFSTIINQEKYNEYYLYLLKIWRIYRFISKGSIACKFHFWMGMYYMECFYRKEAKKYILSDHKKLRKGVFRNNEVTIEEIANKNIVPLNDRPFLNKSHSADTELGLINYTQSIDPEIFLSPDNTMHTNKPEHSLLHDTGAESDDGYAVFDSNFYEYYLNKYFYAIAPYGKLYLSILFIKERCKPDLTIPEPRRGLLSYLNIKNKNLLSVKLNHNETKTPHIMFYDEIEDELVVSMRGTSSHLDALNDLDCEYIQFLDGYAHAGFVKLAYSFIENHERELLELIAHKKYFKVLFTGQSLGGALCILIQIILKHKKHNFKSRVIAFSTPPVVSENLCNQDSIISIIYGYDIIPRLCFGSLLDLKFLCTSLSKMRKSDDSSISKIRNFVLTNDLHPKLYIPGQLYHFRKFIIGNKIAVMSKKVDFLHFEEIIIHKKCFLHHTFTAFINAFILGIDESK